jgi:hypothetical protein
LRKALAGVGGNDGHGQRHNQAADDQDWCSGEVKWSPNVFPIEARFPIGVLRFLPFLNNPWNLATARRRAAPDANNYVNSDALG